MIWNELPTRLTVPGATLPAMPKAWGPLVALDPESPDRTLELFLLDEDLRDVVDAPAHQLHELQRVVPEVVLRPAAVFEGLRREGSLSTGRAYSGRPASAFDNRGQPVPLPEGKCYVVFVTPRGSVYDWDWVPEGSAGVPKDWEKRFGRQVWPVRCAGRA